MNHTSIQLFILSTLLACSTQKPSSVVPDRSEPVTTVEVFREEVPREPETPPAPPPITSTARANTPIDGDTPSIKVLSPRNDAVVRRGDIMLQLEVSNWNLEPTGKHVHLIIDNEPYIAIRDVTAPININALFQSTFSKPLAEGSHLLRLFTSRGHHESVKIPGNFIAMVVHLKKKTPGFAFDPTQPLLTYSRPKGCNVLGQPLLVDFYLNAVDFDAGHRVQWSIGPTPEHPEGAQGNFDAWMPYDITGLRSESLEIELKLVDANGTTLEPIAYNQTRRSITLKSSCN